MTQPAWVQLYRWYKSLNSLQRWLTNLASAVCLMMLVVVVTHQPSQRPLPRRIILNCDHCGSDPERTITYNEYMDQKEQAQKSWFHDQHQRIKQEAWDSNGKKHWCQNHPHDYNCKKERN